MRMRKKKNLAERLEKVQNILIQAQQDDLNYETANDTTEYLDLKSFFNNDNPTELEIGCGKGQFIIELAKRNPNINYIAVEKVKNVIVAACEKAIEENLHNILFVACGAEYLPKYLKPKSVNRIYLNFSCPFPKNRHETHRLTHANFLKIYKELLKDGAEIHQKTDNMKLFEFSIEQFSQNGFALKNISLDLHHSDFEGNIVTEYEQRFSSQGFPIYRLEAYIK